MSESMTKKIENNPEVIERASRRRFTLDYKSRIAAEAEQCSKPAWRARFFVTSRRLAFIDGSTLASSISEESIVII